MMDGPEAARRLGLAQGLLFNDFEAQALSLPTIPQGWARPIGPVGFGAAGPQVILGPGTGLGIGALVEAAGRHTPLASEACHIDFGPVGEEESALWPHLERVYGRVTTESVLAGPGLARVHAARVVALGGPKPTLDPAAVVAAALADRSGAEATSLRLYWRIVARFAGDMGVAFVATGGVTLAGGVLPRIVDFLDDSAFRSAFEAKAPVDALGASHSDPPRHPRRRGARWHGRHRRRAAALRDRLRRASLGVSVLCPDFAAFLLSVAPCRELR